MTLTAVEFHLTVSEGIQRVVLAHTYIFTRIVNCAALTNDDVACDASLTTPNLNA